MDIQNLDSELFYRIAHAINRTLLHSIWQGLILVMLVGVVLLITKKSRSNLRYNLLISLLFIFALVSAFTFWIEFRKDSSTTAFSLINLNNFSETPVKSYFIKPGSDSKTTFQPIEYSINLVNRNASLIFIIWLVIFTFKIVGTANGLVSIHRNRKYNTVSAKDFWLQRLNQLSEKLGVKKDILLAESEMISSPMVQGIFKPMIIVPLGFFTNLPHNQIDAILLHELAHIRRKDYLINLLQSFIDDVFFFNPAVFWLSKLIREERECCCDDLAIHALENKILFVNALVSFQEYRLASSEKLITFISRKNHLLYRIRRIILNNNKSLSAMEKFFITGCIVLTAFLTVAFSKVDQNKKTKPSQHANVLAYAKNGIPLMQKANMTKPAIDTNKIVMTHVMSIDTLPRTQVLSQEVIEAKNQLDLAEKESRDLWKTQRKRMAILWESKRQNVELKLRSDAFQKQKNDIKTLAEKITADAGNSNKAAKFQSEEKQYQLSSALSKMQEEVLKIDSVNLRNQLEAARLIEEDYEKNYESHENKMTRARQNYHQKLQDELIKDLLNEGVIKNKENLSFKLHNKFFIVNGVTQTDVIQEKFKAKYLDVSWKEWLYNYEGKTGYYVTGIRFQE